MGRGQLDGRGYQPLTVDGDAERVVLVHRAEFTDDVSLAAVLERCVERLLQSLHHFLHLGTDTHNATTRLRATCGL